MRTPTISVRVIHRPHSPGSQPKSRLGSWWAGPVALNPSVGLSFCQKFPPGSRRGYEYTCSFWPWSRPGFFFWFQPIWQQCCLWTLTATPLTQLHWTCNERKNNVKNFFTYLGVTIWTLPLALHPSFASWLTCVCHVQLKVSSFFVAVSFPTCFYVHFC